MQRSYTLVHSPGFLSQIPIFKKEGPTLTREESAALKRRPVHPVKRQTDLLSTRLLRGARFAGGLGRDVEAGDGIVHLVLLSVGVFKGLLIQ